MELQARRRVSELLTGHRSLRDVAEWFSRLAWELEESRIPSDELRQFVSEIELSLAEYTSGHRGEEDLLEAFGEALSSYRTSIDLTPGLTTATRGHRRLPRVVATDDSPSRITGSYALAV